MTLEEFKKELADIDKGVRPFPATAQVSRVNKNSSEPFYDLPCSGVFTSSILTLFWAYWLCYMLVQHSASQCWCSIAFIGKSHTIKVSANLRRDDTQFAYMGDLGIGEPSSKCLFLLGFLSCQWPTFRKQVFKRCCEHSAELRNSADVWQVATQQGKYLGHLFGKFEVDPEKNGMHLRLCTNLPFAVVFAHPL